MLKAYEKPRILPRTERHLWPREALILDTLLSSFCSIEDAVQQLEDAKVLHNAGKSSSKLFSSRNYVWNGKHLTADEQELKLYRRELISLYNRRKV